MESTATNNSAAPSVSYDDMVKVGMHFGRKKTVFHPNMKPYIYTSRENIYIIDLIKTADKLADAVAYMQKMIAEGKKILFVGTTRQSADIVERTAKALAMPYVTHRWLGGTLTNFKVIISRVAYLEELEKEQNEGGFEKYTKKERLLKEREIESMRKKYDGLRGLTKLPEVVFVASLKDSDLAIREAQATGTAAIGIVNTDSDPHRLQFPIPANDNARKSVELVLDTIKSELENVQPVPKEVPVDKKAN